MVVRLGIRLDAGEVLLYSERLSMGGVYLTTQRLAMDWVGAWQWGPEARLEDIAYVKVHVGGLIALTLSVFMHDGWCYTTFSSRWPAGWIEAFRKAGIHVEDPFDVPAHPLYWSLRNLAYLPITAIWGAAVLLFLYLLTR